MITKAIIKEGGLFIPNVELDLRYSSRKEVKIDFQILEKQSNETIFQKAAELLKDKKIDPLKFQDDQRNEWGAPL